VRPLRTLKLTYQGDDSTTAAAGVAVLGVQGAMRLGERRNEDVSDM